MGPRLNSRSEMIKFLDDHDRSFVGNPRKGDTSFAVKMNLPGELTKNQLEEWGIRRLIEQFSAEHEGWAADINGDSPKYLVLYEGRESFAGALLHCYTCGLWTQHKQPRPCTELGCEGTLTLPLVAHVGWGSDGAGPDSETSWIKEITKVVLAFDKLAEKCKAAVSN